MFKISEHRAAVVSTQNPGPTTSFGSGRTRYHGFEVADIQQYSWNLLTPELYITADIDALARNVVVHPILDVHRYFSSPCRTYSKTVLIIVSVETRSPAKWMSSNFTIGRASRSSASYGIPDGLKEEPMCEYINSMFLLTVSEVVTSPYVAGCGPLQDHTSRRIVPT